MSENATSSSLHAERERNESDSFKLLRCTEFVHKYQQRELTGFSTPDGRRERRSDRKRGRWSEPATPDVSHGQPVEAGEMAYKEQGHSFRADQGT